MEGETLPFLDIIKVKFLTYIMTNISPRVSEQS